MRIRQRSITVAMLAFVASGTAFAQRATISDTPLSDRRVAYTIEAELDVESRTISGTEHLRWRNPDRVPVGELQFHLYLNAFRNANSTFMKESGGRHRGFSAEGENQWGGIDIVRMERVLTEVEATIDQPSGGRVDLTPGIEFIQPDDNNVDDMTVISVPLDRPAQPGEWVDLEIEFTSSLPKIIARTGWELDEDGAVFVMAAQWFPKIGVLEIPGQRYVPEDAVRGVWNTHQFHANTEFYADFGTYDVSITTPADYVVGATGIRVDERSPTDPSESSTESSQQTVRYVAEDVHDFAWTASPSFLEFTDSWEHVNLRLLLRPEHRRQAARHFAAAKAALKYYDEWLGEYPYTTLTLVDGYGGSNGMEYPTLITCGTYYGLPDWFRILEVVTIHEFGHQYFYGILASNEFEEAWLDEGMNSFIETRIMDAEYGVGADIDFPGLPVGSKMQQRLSYTENRPESGAIFTRAWEYGPGDYGKSTYAKPATVMNSLEGYLGFDRMTTFLREYYSMWRFRHPTTDDLQEVVERTSGEDLDWFFDQFVFGTAVVDYEVSAISVDTTDEGRGSTVRVARLADGYFPQTLRVTFEDGAIETLEWDGRDREREWQFEREAAVREAYLDPEHKVALDINRINNRRSLDTANPFAVKVKFKVVAWTQQLVYLLAGIL